MDRFLPFKTEYARSGRSTCRHCHKNIENNTLRISKRTRSLYFDGVEDHWFHPDCIFSMPNKPGSIGVIANFDNIKWDDQELLKQKTARRRSEPIPSTSKMVSSPVSLKRPASEDYSRFIIQYAASDIQCYCDEIIKKGEIMVCEKEKDTGLFEDWHHLQCFVDLREDFKFSSSGNSLPGFYNLNDKDQAFVTSKLVSSPVSLKRPASEDYSRFIIQYAASDIQCYCDEIIKKGEIMVCEKEKDTGLFEDWHHLQCFVDLREDFKFFSSGSSLPGFFNLNDKDQAFVLQQLPPVNDENLPPTAKREKKMAQKTNGMSKLEIAMMMQNEQLINMRNKLESYKVTKDDMTELLTHNDQRYHIPIDDLRNALADRLTFGSIPKCLKCSGRRRFISNYGYVCTRCSDVDRNPERKEFKIPFHLREKYEFLKLYTPKVQTRLLRAIAPKSLSVEMIEFEQPNNCDRSINRDELHSSLYKNVILDTKTDFRGIANIYQCNGTNYSATLGFTDIVRGYNSFYILKILKYCNEDKYSLFRSWGRTGTQIGSTKVDIKPLDSCIENFEILFFEKTGNMWNQRSHFTKKPLKMHMMDIEDSANLQKLTNIKSEIKSKLEPTIQRLMSLIFNINIMQNTLVDFKIDLNKMPLGKLSKSQINEAFEVLKEIQNLILSGKTNQAEVLDASNKFYTWIPHSCGIFSPPVINNPKLIQEKCEMLNALLEIEIAFNLINSRSKERQHPLDAQYEQLHTKIDSLHSDSEEYKIILKYIKNTHAHTHSNYTLEIENVFKIERHGEADRYQFFENLPNKKLLWHGSRTSNFAGILSQGLRIAPPEAPGSGYMFGKGIYFADMVSKSANYCFADKKNSTGLLLLCEVALGNMYEKHRADTNLRLPRDKHSTFGRGITFPHPDELYRFPNGTEVPYGTPVEDLEEPDLELLYNEYIVYNPAQVRTRYLVQVKFNFLY